MLSQVTEIHQIPLVVQCKMLNDILVITMSSFQLEDA